MIKRWCLDNGPSVLLSFCLSYGSVEDTQHIGAHFCQVTWFGEHILVVAEECTHGDGYFYTSFYHDNYSRHRIYVTNLKQMLVYNFRWTLSLLWMNFGWTLYELALCVEPVFHAAPRSCCCMAPCFSMPANLLYCCLFKICQHADILTHFCTSVTKFYPALAGFNVLPYPVLNPLCEVHANHCQPRLRCPCERGIRESVLAGTSSLTSGVCVWWIHSTTFLVVLPICGLNNTLMNIHDVTPINALQYHSFCTYVW